MTFQLQWTIEGQTQLSRKLVGLRSDLKDYTRPFSDSAFYLKSVFSRDVFDTQGAAIGERWKRLSPYTVAQKARHGYPSSPLIGSGAMQNSFKTIVSSDQAVIYNTAAYFKYHQSKAPRSRIPRRVMMKLASRQKEEVVRVFQQYIRESMRKH
jgi:phage gpG-like protein